MVKIAVSLTVAIFYENPKNGQCSGHCGLKMASGERVKQGATGVLPHGTPSVFCPVIL